MTIFVDNQQKLNKLLSDGLLWSGSAEGGGAPQNYSSAPTNSVLSFGISEVDASLPQGGLNAGAIHEWTLETELSIQKKHCWFSPLLPLSSFVPQALVSGGLAVWVGKRCWLSPHTLERVVGKELDWKKNCLFINPPNANKRLWTIIQLIRSSAVRIIIADGEKLPLLATRRLQLAVKDKNCFLFLVRPPWELELLSTAQTKWRISPAPSESELPHWKLELIRCRSLASVKKWFIEWVKDENGKTYSLRLSPNVVNRPGLSTNVFSKDEQKTFPSNINTTRHQAAALNAYKH